MEGNVKPLKPTKEQKRAIVKALDEFNISLSLYVADGGAKRSRARYEEAYLALLALLGITEEEWREM